MRARPTRGLALSALAAALVHPACAQAIWVTADPGGGSAFGGGHPAFGRPLRVLLDEGRGRMVAFGSGGHPEDGMAWEWSLFEWRLKVRSLPVALGGPGDIVHDAARRQFVAISEESTLLGDEQGWRPATPAQQVPYRTRASLVCDPVRQRVLLFGGWADAALGDTWEWDGNTWAPRTTPTAPTPRRDARTAWDAARQRVVLFGGEDAGGGSNDTWEWDGSAWRQVPTTGQPGWAQQAMGYDPTTQRVVLLGGVRGDVAAADAFAFDGTDWSPMATPAGLLPRAHCAVAHDGESFWVFGGAQRSAPAQPWQARGDAFRLWHGHWTRLPLAEAPEEQPDAAVAFDPARGGLLRFGGSADGSEHATWTWNGQWHRHPHPAGSLAPARRVGAAAAALASTGRVVLFGGRGRSGALRDDTWLWDGAGWTAVATSWAPPARHGASMCWHPESGEAVLFGGLVTTGPTPLRLADTWSFDGSRWRQWDPGRSGGPSDGRLVHDPARGELLLVGSATWAWRGNRWQQLATQSPGTAPAAFDPETRTVIAPGPGLQWNGTAWSPRPLTAPFAGSWHVLSDPVRGRILAVGGPGNSMVAILSPTPAAALVYGAGCGFAAVPVLAAPALPVLGHATFALEADARGAGLPVFFMLGLTEQRLSVGPCSVLVGSPIANLPATSGAGGWATLPIPIPPLYGTRGLAIHCQAAVLLPGGPAQGFALSRGLSVRIGE